LAGSRSAGQDSVRQSGAYAIPTALAISIRGADLERRAGEDRGVP
jgi:hypothetical protein